MSDLESKRVMNENCQKERKAIAKEIILRYLASPGVDSVSADKLFKHCPVLTTLDWHMALVEIEGEGGTIVLEEDSIDGWGLHPHALKFETPEFIDPVTRGSLSGSLLHDGAVYLALENEYQKKRRKF